MTGLSHHEEREEPEDSKMNALFFFVTFVSFEVKISLFSLSR